MLIREPSTKFINIHNYSKHNTSYESNQIVRYSNQRLKNYESLINIIIITNNSYKFTKQFKQIINYKIFSHIITKT